MSEIKADELEHIAYLQTLEIQKLTARIAALEAENAELREGRTLYDTYMSDEAMRLIIASKQALEAEVAALKEERRWIPVSERLPEKHTPVWVTTTWGEQHSGFLIDGVWTGLFRDFREGEITHWMPLPEPPIVYGKEREENV